MNKVKYFDNGMTLRELRDILRDCTLVDEYGDELYVWIEDGKGLSSTVKSAWPLSKRGDYHDLILMNVSSTD